MPVTQLYLVVITKTIDMFILSLPVQPDTETILSLSLTSNSC